ncbi:hypothetical protein J6590_079551 [Homalodisca vitripennis]|nr:hypothetical protein J6590_079551 [Homalodisca vitripennis]
MSESTTECQSLQSSQQFSMSCDQVDRLKLTAELQSVCVWTTVTPGCCKAEDVGNTGRRGRGESVTVGTPARGAAAGRHRVQLVPLLHCRPDSAFYSRLRSFCGNLSRAAAADGGLSDICPGPGIRCHKGFRAGKHRPDLSLQFGPESAKISRSPPRIWAASRNSMDGQAPRLIDKLRTAETQICARASQTFRHRIFMSRQWSRRTLVQYCARQLMGSTLRVISLMTRHVPPDACRVQGHRVITTKRAVSNATVPLRLGL